MNQQTPKNKKSLLYTVWRLDFPDGSFYYAFGVRWEHAVSNLMKFFGETIDRDMDWATKISEETCKRILIKSDKDDDEEELVTLFEEALFYQESSDYRDFIVSHWEVITDLSMESENDEKTG